MGFFNVLNKRIKKGEVRLMCIRKEILQNICYTELVYERINKKLNANFSKEQIEKLIFEIIKKTDENCFEKIGKNYYVASEKCNIKITINSNTFRIITVDKIKTNRKNKLEIL